MTQITMRDKRFTQICELLTGIKQESQKLFQQELQDRDREHLYAPRIQLSVERIEELLADSSINTLTPVALPSSSTGPGCGKRSCRSIQEACHAVS